MKLRLAVTSPQRLVGLGGVQDSDVLLLAPCKDIHTFGMTKPIDIAFVSQEGVVVRSERSVLPLQRRRCANAVAVLERFEQRDKPWFAEGEQLELVLSGSINKLKRSDFKVMSMKGAS